MRSRLRVAHPRGHEKLGSHSLRVPPLPSPGRHQLLLRGYRRSMPVGSDRRRPLPHLPPKRGKRHFLRRLTHFRVLCKVSVEIPLFDGGHVTSEDALVGVEHVSDLESVCVATRNGDILLCNTHTGHVSGYYSGTHILPSKGIYNHAFLARGYITIIIARILKHSLQTTFLTLKVYTIQRAPRMCVISVY